MADGVDVAKLVTEVEYSSVPQASAALRGLDAASSSAEKSIAHMVGRVKELQAAHQAGRVGTAQYSAAMGALANRDFALLNQIMDQVGSKTQQTTARVDAIAAPVHRMAAAMSASSIASRAMATGMAQAGAEADRARQAQAAFQKQVDAGSASAGKGGVALGRFTNALNNLGLGAVGIGGPMGKVIETIAILGLGGVLVTGVLAGVAAIVGVFRLLTAESRRVQEAANEAAKAVAGEFVTAMATALHQSEDLAAGMDRAAKKSEFWSNGGNNKVAFWKKVFTGVDEAAEETTRLANAGAQVAVVLERIRKARAQPGIDFVANLQKQADTYGMTAAQMRMYEVQVSKVLTAEQRVNAVRLANQLTAAEELARGKEYVKGLQDQVESFGKTTQQMRIYGIEKAKLPGVEKAAALALAEQLTQMENLVRMGKDAASAIAQLTGTYEKWLEVQEKGTLDSTSHLFTKTVALGGTGPSFKDDPFPKGPSNDSIVSDALRAGDALGEFLNKSKQAGDSWQGISQSVANVVTLLANADDQASRFLGTLVTAVGQIEDAIALSAKATKDGEKFKLGATDTIGLIATGVTLLSGLLGGGESPQARKAREVQESNTQALRELTKGILAQVSGADFSSARGAIDALLAAGQTGIGRSTSGIGVEMFDKGNVNDILKPFGLNLRELEELLAKINPNLRLNTDSTSAFIESLEQVRRAMQLANFGAFAKTWEGQLSLLQDTLQLADITDPMKQLQAYLDLIHKKGVGSDFISRKLEGFDLNTAGGRSGAETFIQEQMRRLALGTAEGGFTMEELGGLSPDQMREFFKTFEGLIDQINDQLKLTVDGLREFGKSLLLDQSLTTLSPAQQLAEARRRYEETLAAAQGGDQTAAGNLPAIARQFLELSRQFNASSPAYAADFARVMAETEALAKMFEGQQGLQESIKEHTGQMVNLQGKTNERLEKIEQALQALVGVSVASANSRNGLLKEQIRKADEGARKIQRSNETRRL